MVLSDFLLWWDTCMRFLGPSDEAFLCKSQGTKLKNLTVDSSTKSGAFVLV